MNNTDSQNESATKGTLYRYGFDRSNTANKICTVLKYISLTHPNLQMPELRGIFEQNYAASLLTEIIESFSSNYYGGYYGEIYDNANYN